MIVARLLFMNLPRVSWVVYTLTVGILQFIVTMPLADLDITIYVSTSAHLSYAQPVCTLIEASARVRGTGIAKRDPEYVRTKIRNGNAVIALREDTLVGFCYIETWDHGRYVANSGLVVAPEFRRMGMASKIKSAAFALARRNYPTAKIFGITTSLPVMRINSRLGYQPVTFSELTQDEVFWKGCQSCPNYDILQRNERRICLCTGMLYDPNDPHPKN